MIRRRGGRYFSSRDSTRSASLLPPVWQVGHYCRVESAKITSRTMSPQIEQGSLVRACTCKPDFFFSFFSFSFSFSSSSDVERPSPRAIAPRRTDCGASKSRCTLSGQLGLVEHESCGYRTCDQSEL